MFSRRARFRWSLSESKSFQVSRSFLSILADLNNAIFWMVSILMILNSSSFSSKPFGTIPSTPTTIGINVDFMFHSFFSS